MNERRHGIMLTGIVALAIALIFLIIRAAEGSAVWSAGMIGLTLASVSAVCFGIVIALDEMEKRPWKSGVVNYRYLKLKKSTRKVLLEFRGAEDVIRNQKQRFLSKAEDFGVDLTIADDDFEEMIGLLNR